MGAERRHAILIDGNGGCASAFAAIAETLRAGRAGWQIRCLVQGSLDDQRLDPAALRGLQVTSDASALLVVVCGAIADRRGEAVLGLDDAGDIAWPLAKLRDLVAGARDTATIAIILISTGGGTLPAQLVRVLDDRAATIVAVASEAGPVLAGLVDGLRGRARDPKRGVVTAASLAAHVGHLHGAEVVLAAAGRCDAELFDPPALANIWRLGWLGGSARTLPAPQASRSDEPLVGAVLPGRFRVDAAIAAGSFGTVFRARQLTVDRDVAVKVISAGNDPGSEEGRLFVQEIQAVARIDHRNVVKLYQADTTPDGRLFFAMELLDGRDLEAISQRGLVEEARGLVLLRQLLAALDAAHQAGLVHADVKPGNAIVLADRDTERLVLIDFGLARLRLAAEASASIGGTPAFMAPEQLRARRVDPRSDQFSAALVFIAVTQGWRRRKASELAPPDEVVARITDPAARSALGRALALLPEDRFASVAAFSAALDGDHVASAPPPRRPPFHGLASFTEADRGRLHGRDRELVRLTELVSHRNLVIVTAPSGVGKTSLLRAGLLPRLRVLDIETQYISCRSVPDQSIDPRSVRLIDQVEQAIEDGEQSVGGRLVAESAALARGGGQSGVLLCVREDFLARLLERLPHRGERAPIVRIGPLDVEGARDAIVRPLAERHLAIDPALLDQLLADLTSAGRQLGVELGWSHAAPVYPPHLQLACAVLYDRLPSTDASLTLAHYRALGGFDAIVGEHLDRVLDGLSAADSSVAREVFLALVSTTQLRSVRTEAELAEHLRVDQRDRLPIVLEALRGEGLIVRAHRPGGELVWELIHDSLVPRVRAWVDRRDLSRRQAHETLRHHLRRTRPDAPSLLSRAELRELAHHGDVVAQLDAEWRSVRGIDHHLPTWGPRLLVERSRNLHRRATFAAFGLGGVVVAGIIAALVARWNAREELRAESAQRDLDLGLVTFELAPFDWDPGSSAAKPVPVAALPGLTWTLHAPAFDDPDRPGDLLREPRLHRLDSHPSPDGLVRFDALEAPGGAAFLVISGRGRAGEACADAVVPLRSLPGYARRSAGPITVRIRVPSCRASHVDMRSIPGGPFWFGGPGDPPSDYAKEFPARATERLVDLPAFSIDRTEVTNAAFAVFGTMRDATGIAAPSYIPSFDFEHAADPQSPAASVTWREARAYCAFLGKRLPTSEEWEKAMRGGTTLDGAPNPSPHRNLPWGTPAGPHQANLNDELPKGLRPVGAFAPDRSPYGVIDLAGGVMEWISSPPTGEADARKFFRDSWRMTRGGNWSETPSSDLVNFTAIENARPGDSRSYTIGLRCARSATP